MLGFGTKNLNRQISTVITNQYKFYVDFKGMLYFNDSKDYIFPNAIKDKKFITQLYSNLRHNQRLKNANTQAVASFQNQKAISHQQQQTYPFVAQFWGQRNLVRCGISPVIFNNIVSRCQVEDKKTLRQNSSFQEFLEFSLGQHSALDFSQLKIDSEGKLWHPFLRPNKNAALTQQILGVLSNQLMSHLLDNIVYEQGQTVVLKYKNKQYRLSKITL